MAYRWGILARRGNVEIMIRHNVHGCKFYYLWCSYAIHSNIYTSDNLIIQPDFIQILTIYFRYISFCNSLYFSQVLQ